jgi:hypothetical protein
MDFRAQSSVVPQALYPQRMTVPNTVRPIIPSSAPDSAPLPLTREKYNALGIQSLPVSLPDAASLHKEISYAISNIKALGPEGLEIAAEILMEATKAAVHNYGNALNSWEDLSEDSHDKNVAAGRILRAEKVVQHQLAKGTDSNKAIQLIGSLNLTRGQQREVLSMFVNGGKNYVPDSVTSSGGHVRSTVTMETLSEIRSARVYMTVLDSTQLATAEVGALGSYSAISTVLKDLQAHFGFNDQEMAQLLRSANGKELEQQLGILAETNPRLAETMGDGSAILNTLSRASFLTQTLEMARKPEMTILNEVAYSLLESGRTEMTLNDLIRPDGRSGLMTFSGASGAGLSSVHIERSAHVLNNMFDSLLQTMPDTHPDSLEHNHMAQLALTLGNVVKSGGDAFFQQELEKVCFNVLWASEPQASAMGVRSLGDIQGRGEEPVASFPRPFARLVKMAKDLGVGDEDIGKVVQAQESLLAFRQLSNSEDKQALYDNVERLCQSVQLELRDEALSRSATIQKSSLLAILESKRDAMV